MARPASEVTDLAQRIARHQAIEQRLRSRRELTLFMRRLGVVLVALALLVVIGTVGWAVFEGTSLGYGLEWTIDTVTTVGSIPEPHDAAARVLKVVVELLGIVTLFYGLAAVAEFFVSGQLSGVLDERRVQKMIDSFADHYIICGFGRVGRQVAHDLKAAGRRLVVIDPNVDNREQADADGIPFIESDASDDVVLRNAGIARARAVMACVDSDAENIFITLTARELRSDILVVARASAEDSEKKLLRAGADRVISPYKTSGSEMARVALHPQVGGAVQVANLRMEEIDVPDDCVGAGKTIRDVRGDSVIVGLRRSEGELEAQPSPDTVIRRGDSLMAIGSPKALERLEDMFQPPEK